MCTSMGQDPQGEEEERELTLWRLIFVVREAASTRGGAEEGVGDRVSVMQEGAAAPEKSLAAARRCMTLPLLCQLGDDCGSCSLGRAGPCHSRKRGLVLNSRPILEAANRVHVHTASHGWRPPIS
jgi:hypothetical protein